MKVIKLDNGTVLVPDKKTIYYCPKCGNPLSQSKKDISPLYFAACLDCDEDFYEFEVTKEKPTCKEIIAKFLKDNGTVLVSDDGHPIIMSSPDNLLYVNNYYCKGMSHNTIVGIDKCPELKSGAIGRAVRKHIPRALSALSRLIVTDDTFFVQTCIMFGIDLNDDDIFTEILEDGEELISHGAAHSVCDSCGRTYPLRWVLIDDTCPFCREPHNLEETPQDEETPQKLKAWGKK